MRDIDITNAESKVSDSLLAVDIGNTNIVLGLFWGGQLQRSVRIKSDASCSADEYHALLAAEALPAPAEIVISSVVPKLTATWQHLAQKHYGIQALTISALSPLGLSFKVADPSFIGSDLIVNGFAAWSKYQGCVIVIDLGTATTVQLITASGSFEGTAIIPGLKTGARGLFQKAAQLFEIELDRPVSLIATNTHDAMLSGIVNSHAFLLEKYIYQLKLQYFDQKPITTVLTGGMAELLLPLMPSVDFLESNLILEGLKMARDKLMQTNQG